MTYLAAVLTILLFSLAVLPLQIKFCWKLALLPLVFSGGFKSQILYKIGGPFFFGPDVPAWLIAIGGWWYGVFIIFLMLIFPVGIVRWGWIIYLKFCNKSASAKTLKWWDRLHVIIFVLAVFCASFGIWRGTMIPKIKDVKVVIPGKLPKSELKLIVLSDLHADRMTKAGKINSLVKVALEAKGDVIVLVGDYTDGRSGKELLPLCQLQAKYGVYAVPGNHEYYSGYKEWKKLMAEKLSNIQILENSSVTLPDGTVIAGVTDIAATRGGRKFMAPDISKAIENNPAEARKILLAHQPLLASQAAAFGVDLQLSGHTHGGMVLGLDILVKMMNGGFVSGLYQKNNFQLYVSNGTGIWNGFPIRIGHDPEITRITITGQ